MITFLFIIDRKKNKTLILTSAEKSRFLAGYLISSHIKQRRLCDLTEVSLSIKLKKQKGVNKSVFNYAGSIESTPGPKCW